MKKSKKKKQERLYSEERGRKSIGNHERGGRTTEKHGETEENEQTI
jgi:hypothetical protein